MHIMCKRPDEDLRGVGQRGNAGRVKYLRLVRKGGNRAELGGIVRGKKRREKVRIGTLGAKAKAHMEGNFLLFEPKEKERVRQRVIPEASKKTHQYHTWAHIN